MTKARSILGLVAGFFLLLSSAAHMLLGWPAIRAPLADVHPPADLMGNIHMGWQLGGAAMIAFGTIVLWTFIRRLRREPVSLFPPAVIAVTYILFGAWAEVVSGGEPFFLITFVVPGIMLGIASMPDRRTSDA